MALPKLNTPTHKLVLPSTGDEITFRPFLVKEQKLLLMAQQNDNENEIVDNVVQIINNCTGLDTSNLPVFDVEYLFKPDDENGLLEILKKIREPLLKRRKKIEGYSMKKYTKDLVEILETNVLSK